MSPNTAITIAGEELALLPQRAAYWPAQRALIVADIHFGKAASFRTSGFPVPRGTTTQNLQMLDQLIGGHDAAQIIFLGDFLHSKAAHADATLAAIRLWRVQNADLRLTLVRGNHDHHAGDPPQDLRIDMVNEPYRLGPFAFCHHPDQQSEAYVIAGHVHPVYHLSGRGDRLRLPCFVFGEQRAILPSFGAFTGGHAIEKTRHEQVFLVADQLVIKMPDV
ncbi:MAG: ligase-associated DNA damage response endonuclease PdeM [Pseudomonadota bacterium]